MPENGRDAVAGERASGEAGSPSAGRPLPALKERVRALVESWTELQSGTWNAMAALAQYEELERISASAEQLNAREIAEPAVEAAVYLCTFVEGRLYPSNSQRQRLNELVETLSAAVSGGRVVPRARERSAELRVLVYLRPRDAEVPNLAAQLGLHRYVVRPCEQQSHALSLIDESLPDAVVVDGRCIAELDALVERVEQVRGEAKGRSVCIVLGEGLDHGRQLFALRAGADLVLESRDPVTIATRLDELLAQQRNLNYRVLVVEDDRSQALFCENVLRHRGMTSRICLTPEEVLPAIADFHPDLVLLDLYLPGMNGIEVAQLIRERPEYAFLPIVFLSGETDLDKRFDAIRMGGDDFMTKPVKPRHLLVEVETRIRRARMLPTRGDGSARAERRGHLVSRTAFLEELKRCVDLAEAEPAALVWIGVWHEDDLREKLGLVELGALSQQLAAALAADSSLARPVCAFGELGFLTVVRGAGDVELKQRIEVLRDVLVSRRWLDTDAPLKLDIVASGIRVPAQVESLDALVRNVRARGRSLQGKDGARLGYEAARQVRPADEDPAQRLARTLLRGHLIPEAVKPEYQPLVPLTGELSGQYGVRFALIAPRATQRLEVPATRLRGIAREMGAVLACDRQCVRRALGVLAERVQRGDEMRLFLPIAIESALDPAFAPWLAAELQARALAPASIALELSIEELANEPGRLASAVESLRLVGSRLCVSGLEGGDTHVRIVRTMGVAAIKLNAPAPAAEGGAPSWGNERGRLVVEAAKHGKVVIATGVRDAREFAELLKLGAHYIQADVFAPWSNEANFDFAGTKV
jgi:DNA-binding response OmpR family regulator/EAL domain-containing protein (putative c-di-GMP-specific phosphodiesterase class I)